MLIVTACTRTYEHHCARLVQSIKAHGYKAMVDPFDDRGAWELNCHRKPETLLAAWAGTTEDLLWLDADAEIKRELTVFDNLRETMDFAVYIRQHHTMPFRSGTVWFNRTEPAKALLDAWAAEAQRRPMHWDQVTLYRVWHAMKNKVRTAQLPLSYCCKFDEEGAEDCHVVHHQASRTLKNKRSPSATSTKAKRSSR